MFPELTAEQIGTVGGEINALLENAQERFTYETAG
jgi:hypothetical protein